MSCYYATMVGRLGWRADRPPHESRRMTNEGVTTHGTEEAYGREAQTEAHEVMDVAAAEHPTSEVWALFSGGHDSLCSTRVAAQHPNFAGVFHVRTGIGIAETWDYIVNTCRRYGWHLVDFHPTGKTYEDLVREKGMPSGPQSHKTMYYWLKQRQVRQFVQQRKAATGDRVILVTGVRRKESTRRSTSSISVPVRRDGYTVWVNPILDWTKKDCNDYITRHDLPRNVVSDVLHRSGECLCGALARHDEIGMIEAFYPAAALEIHRLEDLARERGLPCKWAYAPPAVSDGQESFDLELCASCEARYADEDAA